MQCSESSVYEILCLKREHDLVTNPFACTRGAHEILEDRDKACIKDFLKDKPAAYLDEIQLHLFDTQNVWVSTSTISCAIASMVITNKKISKATGEQDEILRAIWKRKNGRIPMENIVWLDESSVDDLTNQ